MSAKDLYDDLPAFDIGSDVEKLKNENEILHQRILQLEEEVGSLSKTIVNLKKIQKNLATNISELYKTALNEINRKNQIISDLRTQLDNLVFKRQNNNDYNNRRVDNCDRKRTERTRSPSSDGQSLKKFKSEHDHSKSHGRRHYRISPRKLIINRDKDHKYKSRERSSSREHSRNPHARKDKEIVRNNDKKHEKIEILSKEITNNRKENSQNRKINDDNFLKTANSKGNIYKKELFQDKHLAINHKRSENRKIEIVTKKLFDKAAEKRKQLVESEKNEQKSKKRIVEEKKVKVSKKSNDKNDGNKSVHDHSKLVANNLVNNKYKNEIKTRKREDDAEIVGKSKMNVKTGCNPTQQSLENTTILESINEETTCRTIENKKVEKPKHKQEKEIYKKPSVDKKINNKDVDQAIKPKHKEIFDQKFEKSPNTNKTIEEMNQTSKESPIEKKSDENDKQTIETNENEKIPANDVSLEKKMTEIFNNPKIVDEETVQQVVKTPESSNKEQTVHLNDSTDDLNIKECVVQLKTNDILHLVEYKVDDKKQIESPLKNNTDSSESKNTTGRVLRSATKKIQYTETIEEPPVSPVKTIKIKRPRQRKSSPITSTVEIINNEIPVLHLIENSATATKCDHHQLMELASIDLTKQSPEKEIVTSTPLQHVEDSPSSFQLRLSSNENSTNSTIDSCKSNQTVLKPKRRRCIIKMID